MTLAERIRMARRKARLTQQSLADALQVNRSAVSNWEAKGGSSPSGRNMRQLVEACHVAYEWLATGRGEMLLPGPADDAPPANALLVEDQAEMRLLRAFRHAPPRLKLIFLDLAIFSSSSQGS